MSSGSIRIIQLPEKSSVNTDDYMAVDSSANGTKKVKFTDLLDDNLSVQNKAADAQATGEAIGNVSARVDNMINTQTNAEITTLWTGQINLKNETANLSESINNFDFIDVYCGDADTVFARQHVSGNSVHFELQSQNMSDDASVQFMRWWETGLTISGTTATITKAIKCFWDDFSTVPVVSQATGGGINIVRIDGVKIGHIENDEIVDARVGEDGLIYPTLGDAIRGQVDDLKSELYDIREPKENIGYFTQLSERKYTAGVYALPLNKSQLKIWGTGTGWVRLNILRGNSEATSSTPTFTNNLTAGTYTLKADTNILYVFYGTDWDSRTQWANGETITFTADTMIWLSTQTNSQVFGTESNPTIFNLELYQGDVPIVPTAIDRVTREKIEDMEPIEKIVYADFDTIKPYNILPTDTAFTPDTRIRRTTGEVEASSEGYLASDYIPIDASRGYLTVGEYVYLVGETGTGLITGGNRVWAQSYVAFYDENKQYVATASSGTDLAKAIPTNAKYVRMTAISASIIPYAVLVYGNNTSQLWLRYTEYRKEITEACVYASTGMEKLTMVMFGDSITQGSPGLSHDGISFVDYANDYIRSNIINVGFGGTRMSQGSPDTVGLASFASLCETIVSNEADKWDALDAYATTSEPYWDAHIATLKAIDWTKVQAVGLLYGANDWHNNVPIGDSYNENPLNYDGACAYGLKLLLTKYPHLQVIIFTPFYRVADNVDSDTPNGAGLNMDDYGASLKHVQTMFHCPIVDSGNELGINKYTLYSYTATNDGTHPRKLLGLERIGRFFAESVKRYIQPY